jgi:hypothetical protein
VCVRWIKANKAHIGSTKQGCGCYLIVGVWAETDFW